MVQVIRAEHMGFCFGVRDAIAAAEAAETPKETTIYGELVHNAEVTDALQALEFELLREANRNEIPARPNVMITAHGISHQRRESLIDAGKHLIDTTCPLVRRVHEAATLLSNQGYFVVVIGNPKHVEVLGVVEDLPLGRWAVVSCPAEAEEIRAERIGIVCQTTMPTEIAADCQVAITECNPKASIRFINTVCRPTRQRQSAVDQLCQQVDVVIVVGGENSNNTRRLADRCRANGCSAYHVQSADDVCADWIEGQAKVGLTAGTSTPDHVISDVEQRLQALSSQATYRGRAWCRGWSNRQWIDHFKSNRQLDPLIPWSDVPTLTKAERHAVAESVRIFQLGESGEGRNIQRCAQEWIQQGGDPDYLDALRLFLAEENQHAAWLGQFLQQEGVSLLQKQWSHSSFRFLRHLFGLRTSIAVLVTAEIYAQVYYLALMRATDSPTLHAICRRILRDERAHVILQQTQCKQLSNHWGPIRRRTVGLMEWLLFQVTMRVVWHEHGDVFLTANMPWKDFRDRATRRWTSARR